MKKYISIVILLFLTFSGFSQDDTPFQLYRLFSSTGGHLYTIDPYERDKAISTHGFNNEGSEGTVYNNQVDGTIPLYRLRSTTLGNHLYTTDKTERDKAIRNYNFVSEGITCYVYSSAGSGRVPLYRLHNTGTGDHLYTISKSGRDAAIRQHGYVSEGIACYVMP